MKFVFHPSILKSQSEWTMLSSTRQYLQNRKTIKRGGTGGGPVGEASDA
jgi:hypothetical protein